MKTGSAPAGAAGLAAAVRRGQAAQVDKLLKEGVAVNDKLGRGLSALHLAAQEGHVFVAEQLLRCGAEVDVSAFEQITRAACGPGLLSESSQLGTSRMAPAVPRSPLRPQLFEPIDLAPFVRPEEYSDEARQRSASSWDESFRTVGFAVVDGHGVAPDLVEDLRTAAKMFFSSSGDYKHRFFRGQQMTGRSGFSPVGAGNSGHTDPVEGYMFMRHESTKWMGSASENHPEELNGIGQRYCNEMERVMHALHRMSALALGLEESYFERFYDNPASVLVISHYPPLRPPPSTIKMHDGKLRYRAHSDYSGFTILLQDEGDFGEGGGGLEIDIDGTWVPVKPRKGSFVINIGDLFETWTNDRWRSTPHRVVSPKLSSPAAARSRLTVMLFSGPALDSIVAPIRTCVDAARPSRYASVSAADHLRGMYKTKSKEARYESPKAS